VRLQALVCGVSMDYDATDIAVTYDRGREHGPEIHNLWMNVVWSHVNGQAFKTILDLGCGTGRFTEDLAVRFNANGVGIDRSKKMLEQAHRKLRDPRVSYVRGRGEAIPLPDNSVDLIFMSMVFHHFDDPALVARECRRVLRDQGTAFLRAGTRERISSYPYVEFFPESRPLLEECLAGGSMIREVFESAGFRTVAVDVVTQEIAPNFGAYAEKLSAGADSVLARLSPRDYEAGMNKLRLHAARTDSQSVFEPIDVFVFR
jgi:ubiquinone/menaquinone biosynthesis C-methylase UbiE